MSPAVFCLDVEYLFTLFCVFTKNNSRASWDVELQPAFAVTFIDRIVVREVTNGIISEFVTAIEPAVGIEHHIIATLWNDETIVGERPVG